MKTSMTAGGLLALGLMVAPVTAAPLSGARDNPAAGESLIEVAQGWKYQRNCVWVNNGWGHRDRYGKVLVCRPYKPYGRGWVWHKEGNREGWHNTQRKAWHNNKW